jgi:opacity protein-like surface antigen
MKSTSLILAAAILSLQTVRAGTTVTTDNSKDKLISPTQPTAKQGGLYIGIFGGVNASQSGDSKDINVSDARPRTAGTPSEIKSYFAPGSNAGDLTPGSTYIPAGTHLTSPTFSTDTNSNVGWFGGLKLGYEFPTSSIWKPAVEVEGFYNGINTSGDANSNKSIKGLRTSDDDGDETAEPFANPDAVVPATKVNAHFTDQINSAVFMLNGIIKLDLGKFRPYLGAGVGLAYVTHNYDSQRGTGFPVPSNSAVLKTAYGAVQVLPGNHSADAVQNAPAGYFSFNSDNETTFAWQGLAGVEYLVTPHITVFTEYKALFYLDGPYYRNLFNNMVALGVKYNF